ncbi:MAG TPA: sulfate ABC transporter ATP-binding protein [Spirochaetia bacterium]|nr:sulfate ABC transporter ATP-binding protein [Spirochaetia bacterium]
MDLDVARGELVALLGPSGCGKTTLLRVIAGLEIPDGGRVELDGEDATRADARHREVGFVFQHYALFRHLSVFENVAFGLRVRPRATRPPRAEVARRAQRLLELVQMEWAAHRFPTQLSGGQRQRVALARALAVEPRVLLLDEPFSALDAKVRLELRRWLRRLHDEIQVTTVFVTHDQEEALELADRIVIINQGEIVQAGKPEEVYDHPANAFVWSFLGNVNVFHGRLNGSEARFGALRLSLNDRAPEDRREVHGFIRPHDIRVSARRESPHDLPATLVTSRMSGKMQMVEIRMDGVEQALEALVERKVFQSWNLAPGGPLWVRLERISLHPTKEDGASSPDESFDWVI